MTTPQKQIFTLTDAARKRVRHLLERRGKDSAGIRIGVKSKGCSGMQYTMDYADVQSPLDEVVQEGDITLFIDAKAIMFVIGTEMDFVDDTMQSGFVFTNPNEKGKCGCGKSFHV